MTITVGEDGNVTVKAPLAASDAAIKAFGEPRNLLHRSYIDAELFKLLGGGASGDYGRPCLDERLGEDFDSVFVIHGHQRALDGAACGISHVLCSPFLWMGYGAMRRTAAPSPVACGNAGMRSMGWREE